MKTRRDESELGPYFESGGERKGDVEEEGIVLWEMSWD